MLDGVENALRDVLVQRNYFKKGGTQINESSITNLVMVIKCRIEDMERASWSSDTWQSTRTVRQRRTLQGSETRGARVLFLSGRIRPAGTNSVVVQY